MVVSLLGLAEFEAARKGEVTNSQTRRVQRFVKFYLPEIIPFKRFVILCHRMKSALFGQRKRSSNSGSDKANRIDSFPSSILSVMERRTDAKHADL
jgi:hypothetical protein